MPRREYTWVKLGTVSKKGQSFRARIDTSSMGGLVKVQGPCRSENKQRAVEDLLSIRAAADGHTTGGVRDPQVPAESGIRKCPGR